MVTYPLHFTNCFCLNFVGREQSNPAFDHFWRARSVARFPPPQRQSLVIETFFWFLNLSLLIIQVKEGERVMGCGLQSEALEFFT